MAKHLALARNSLQNPGMTLKLFLCRFPMLLMSCLERLTAGLCSMSGSAPSHRSSSDWPGRDMKKAPHLNWFLKFMFFRIHKFEFTQLAVIFLWENNTFNYLLALHWFPPLSRGQN